MRQILKEYETDCLSRRWMGGFTARDREELACGVYFRGRKTRGELGAASDDEPWTAWRPRQAVEGLRRVTVFAEELGRAWRTSPDLGWHVRSFFNHRLASSPRALKAAKAGYQAVRARYRRLKRSNGEGGGDPNP